MRNIVIALLILCQSAASSDAPNCWRGITLLRSTCEDVKRTLKVERCVFPLSTYTLPDFRVLIEFENERCAGGAQGWRVPKGTVTAITLSPRNEMLPSQLGLELSKYERGEASDVVGVEHYYSRKDGVRVELYRGFVQNLFLSPKESEQKMRCKPPTPE